MTVRLNGTLTLHFPREEHGHLRISVVEDVIEGYFSDTKGKMYPVGGSIDEAVNVKISLIDGDVKLRFGENLRRLRQIQESDIRGALANSAGHGTYLGKNISATYVPTPIKTPPQPQQAVSPVERMHGGGYRLG